MEQHNLPWSDNIGKCLIISITTYMPWSLSQGQTMVSFTLTRQMRRPGSTTAAHNITSMQVGRLFGDHSRSTSAKYHE